MAQRSTNQTQLLSSISQALIVVVMVFNSTGFAAELKTETEKTMSQQLPPCPQSPNCVSSTDADLSHRVLALSYDNSAADKAMLVLKKVLLSMTGQVQLAEDGKSLHAEFKSAVFGFIDDVDALLNTEQARIEIRSASRTGHSDFGVNKRRVETIRQAFDQALKQAN